MGAIVWHKSEKGTKAHSEIDRDECVERGVCRRASVCPADAILEENLQWAREAARIYLTL